MLTQQADCTRVGITKVARIVLERARGREKRREDTMEEENRAVEGRHCGGPSLKTTV